MAGPLPIGVLVSGRGSNLQALLDAARAGTLGAEIRIVISNVAGAPALDGARAANVPTAVIEHGTFADRSTFERELAARLRGSGAEWVVLAGFMRLLSPTFLEAFPGRVINIHPSLLPAFPGVRAQAQALEHGVRVAGCTVHLVDAGTDAGPILGQTAVRVLPDDDVGTLSARILREEHRLLVAVVRAIAQGRLDVRGRSTRFWGGAPRDPAEALTSPLVDLGGT